MSTQTNTKNEHDDSLSNEKNCKRLNSHSSIASLVCNEDNNSHNNNDSYSCDSSIHPDMQITHAMESFYSKHCIKRNTTGTISILLEGGLTSAYLFFSGMNLFFGVFLIFCTYTLSSYVLKSYFVEIFMSLLRMILFFCINYDGTMSYALLCLAEALIIQIMKGKVYMFTGAYEKYILGVILIFCGDHITSDDIIATIAVLDIPTVLSKLFWLICKIFDEHCSSFPTFTVLFVHALFSILTIIASWKLATDSFTHIGNTFIWSFLIFNVLKLVFFKIQDLSAASQNLYVRKMYHHHNLSNHSIKEVSIDIKMGKAE